MGRVGTKGKGTALVRDMQGGSSEACHAKTASSPGHQSSPHEHPPIGRDGQRGLHAKSPGV